MLTDGHVFPREVVPAEALDFYLQSCSIEVGVQVGADIASTLAAGGVCPLTGERCLSPHTAKATSALMMSCGMYDFRCVWSGSGGVCVWGGEGWGRHHTPRSS